MIHVCTHYTAPLWYKPTIQHLYDMYPLYSTFMICTHYIAPLWCVPPVQHLYMYPLYSTFMTCTHYTAPLWFVIVNNWVSTVPACQRVRSPAPSPAVWGVAPGCPGGRGPPHDSSWGPGPRTGTGVCWYSPSPSSTTNHKSPRETFIIAIHRIIWHCRLRVFLYVSVSFV